MNTVELKGTIVAQEDLIYSASGVAVKEITVAGINQVVRRGKITEIPWYHRVSFLGKAAETNMNHPENIGLNIIGALDYSEWENKEGKKRSKLGVKGLFALPFNPDERTRLDGTGQKLFVYGQNRVTLLGNLTRDPDTRVTKGDNTVANLGIAVNDRWTNDQDEEQTKAHYVKVTAWDELGNRAAQYTTGQRVLVHGRLSNESWNSDDGKQYRTFVEASDISTMLAKAA